MEPIINAAPDDKTLIKDSDERAFAQDVIDASQEALVLVDFWADWCQPCKQLTPALEAAVRKARGKARLVKINVDQNQGLAAQLRIQSLPTVYVFKDGRPVDGFQGAVPESQITQIIDAHASEGSGNDQIEAALDQAAQLLDAGDAETAAALYAQILQADGEEKRALAGLAQAQLKLGQPDEARALLDAVPEAERAKPPFSQVQAALDLAAQATAAGDPQALKARIEKDPDDLAARYDLALALAAAGDRAGAGDQLLEILRRDRSWNDDAARKQLVTLFEAAGPTDSFTLEYRRALSSLLFA
ncbi:thioredoxin [Rhodothalassium salexigens DSM 2132]|uniref:Thioredoxin n=1 Tax=Rhodothalassium salexigens DSM 2132 TaxID=1188247 RepID=A0A4R2PAN0_RHOSA|nr:thioredoxin [Rhodothalassium salexigens]MBB4212522.1 putative thioredoxin [Rhodothalassium salexigens DSM 2132]MBK1640175.1 thioredoxin [Rhodothalassium salexigens DSM 2132]TCP31438.1 thioredoxin [Rhodothalassium salexigens DSM 2132]